MTQSALVTRTIPHHNKLGSRDGRSVDRVIQHHWAGPGGDARLANPTQQASSNYLIFSDGTIAIQVPEEYRAWTSGSYGADVNSITIEVENSSYQKHGNDGHSDSWAISDAAYNSIVALLADITRRYGWGSVTDDRYRGHREFSATACPGGYLWARMADIRNRANTALNSAGGGASISPVGNLTSPAQEEGPMFTPQDRVFTAIDGNKASLETVLNSIDTKTTNSLKAATAALQAVGGILATRIPDPTDPKKSYTIADYIVWSATNAKVAAGNAAKAMQNTAPEALAAAVSEAQSSVTAADIADQLQVNINVKGGK